jgi:hypothetical protein
VARADSFQNDLRSSLPTRRSRALAWLLENPTEASIEELVLALQSESVPQFRQYLNQILSYRQSASANPGGVAANVAIEATQPLTGDIASLIRHELSPPIGWVRLAADAEIEDFASSATNIAVRKLQRRIDGLVSLIKQPGNLNPQPLDLVQALRDSWPDPSSSPELQPEVSWGEASLEVEIDESLFVTLMANAYQNALDGSRSAGALDVQTLWGSSPGRFWIRVTNSFAGDTFHLEDVLRTGVSSKKGSQGQGLFVMSTAADLLGVAFTLEGRGGKAEYTLTGSLS